MKCRVRSSSTKTHQFQAFYCGASLDHTQRPSGQSPTELQGPNPRLPAPSQLSWYSSLQRWKQPNHASNAGNICREKAMKWTVCRAAIAALMMCLTTAQAAKAEGGYCIVVSKSTCDDPQWKPVVDALVVKHQGTVITFEKTVKGSWPTCKRSFPDTCASLPSRPRRPGNSSRRSIGSPAGSTTIPIRMPCGVF